MHGERSCLYWRSDSCFKRCSWPRNLSEGNNLCMCRTLHEKEVRKRRGMTRLQFFLIAFVCSFAYYIVPNYLFQAVSLFSVACYIWKDNIFAQQMGSGDQGLGIGAFGLDWSTVTGYLGSPLSSPGFAILNVAAGFILFLYIIVPIAYFNNFHQGKRFPFASAGVFDGQGQSYHPTSVINQKSFEFDPVAYAQKGPVHLSNFFALAYGLNFATLTAVFSHVIIFHGRCTPP